MAIYRKRSRRIPIAEAKTQLTRILRDVERGSTAEITRRGKPVAAVVPIEFLRRLAAREGDDFVSASERWRRSAKVEELGLENAFARVRDRSPGRDEPVW